MEKSFKIRQLCPRVIKVEPTQESIVFSTEHDYCLPKQKKSDSYGIYIIIVLLSFWLLSR